MKNGQVSQQCRLSCRELREIEKEFKVPVYLEGTRFPVRSAVQQFAVYTEFNEEERLAGNIYSKGPCFTADELRRAIKKTLKPFDTEVK
jgi:hypothetical protein